MPIYNKTEVGRGAQQNGFVRDTFEKVLRLKEILKYLNEEEFLREHLLLKEYMPELLFDDKAIVERIQRHPMALWKCQ